MSDHLQTKVNIEITCDEVMGRIVYNLNRIGLLTQSSCQGDFPYGQRSFVVFPDISHGIYFSKFLEKNKIFHVLNSRAPECGWGAAVDFNYFDIEEISSLLEEAKWYFDGIVHSFMDIAPIMEKLVEEFDPNQGGWKLIYEYNPERSQLDSSSLENEQIIQLPQVQNGGCNC